MNYFYNYLTKFLNQIKLVKRDAKFAGESVVNIVVRYMFYRLKGVNLISASNTKILGLENIKTRHNGFLKIGLNEVGFVDSSDHTLLRIRGVMNVSGRLSIGRGCRMDIGPNAIVNFQSGNINPFTKIIIMNGLEVGSNCVISWDCLFLDEDFHDITYPGKKLIPEKGITIGNNVWIGNGVSVLKGAHIPEGTVVAANSVVKSAFYEKNTLLAGNPAQVIKRNISWM